MKLKDDGSQGYVLSTGREFYANCGIIGLAEHHIESDPLEAVQLPEGYDGTIHLKEAAWAADTSSDWTQDEMRELADFMLDLWQRWKDSITATPQTPE